MAFFDNISKTVNNATRGAVKKTKDVSEVAKLNTQISNLKAEAGQKYQALGERYFQLCGDAPPQELAELVADLKALNSKIHDCEKEIQTLKGMIQCPNCGKLLERDAVFCSVCGTPLPKISPPDNLTKCENCGAMVKKGTRFCTFCGKLMASLQPTTEAAVPASNNDAPCSDTGVESAPAGCEETESSHDLPQPEQEVSLFCPNCGMVVSSDSEFCPECGVKL